MNALKAPAPSAHWPRISGIEGARQRAPQAEVDDHLAARHLALLAVELDGGHRRIGERVLEHGGDAAGRGRHGAGGEVLALGVAGILEVRVHVDRAGQHHQPGGVDQLVGAGAVGLLDDRRHAAVLDHEVGGEHAVVGRQRCRRRSPCACRSSRPPRARTCAAAAPDRRTSSARWMTSCARASDQRPLSQARRPSPSIRRASSGASRSASMPGSTPSSPARAEHRPDLALPAGVGLDQLRGELGVAAGVGPHLRPQPPLAAAHRIIRDRHVHQRHQRAGGVARFGDSRRAPRPASRRRRPRRRPRSPPACRGSSG